MSVIATVNFINRPKSQTRAGMLAVINYIMQDKKTVHDGVRLVSGLNCSPLSACQEFINTKLQYGKTDGRMYYHFVQSFPPDETITPQTAHEIAMKLAEHYNNFEVLVATHSDRNHIHSHFIINSVSFETGKKLHQKSDAIDIVRTKSDELCRQYSLSICRPKNETYIKPVSAAEYRSAAKGESWKLTLAIMVDECMKTARDKANFIELMGNEGYAVRWTDERKYITYTTPDGQRCRDHKLHERKYLKGCMEDEFRNRHGILYGLEGTSKAATAFGQTGRADNQSDRTELEFANCLPLQPAADAGGGLGATEYADDRGGYAPPSAFAEERIRGAAPESERNFDVDARGNEGIFETGWEVERAEFIESLTAERTDEAFYETAVSDWADPNHFLSGMGVDLLYLAADLSQIMDDDAPIQDSTTIRYKPERKQKNQGPKMSM